MSPRTIKLVKRLTALAVVISVLTCLMPAIAVLIDRLSGHAVELRWSRLAWAIGLSIVYWPVNAYVWNMVLGALGHSLPGGTAIRIWCITQTCRWLPGGVWHYGSRTMQAVAHGIPSTVAVASVALELLLTIIAWAILAAVGIAIYGSQQLQSAQLFSSSSLGWLLASVAGLAAIVPAAWLAKRWFPQKFQALQERFAALRLVRPRLLPTLVCLIVYVLLSLLNGVAFYAVIAGVSPSTEVPLIAAISANALAWLVGLFAVMAPGGLVVRETTLALQLGLWMPPAVAVLVAVMWRLVQLVVEFIFVAIALIPQPGAIPQTSAVAVSIERACD